MSGKLLFPVHTKSMKHLTLSVVVFLLVVLILPAYSFAGKIYLKDGSIEISSTIWETDQFVHFILNGTRSVEIRFSKTIVSKIEYDDGTIQNLDRAEITIEHLGEKGAASLSTSTEPIVPPAAVHSINTYISEEEKQKILKANRGHHFYDPRRKKRFWARHDARFETLEQAMEALSAVYNRPVSWVEKYMGEENDLAVIHQNLIRQMEREIADSGKGQQTDTDPQASTTAFLPQSDKPKKLEDKSPADVPVPEDRSQDPDSVNGLKFYDPRRPYKYWSSANDRHQTLDDAINALANSYHVSPQWIESHMGASNDLDAIHRHIQQSLKRK